jgi:pimeloyl-ACP methyl ester carboxylesterase
MRIDLGSGVFGYEVRGSGEPLVLLLHAFPLHRAMWTEQLDALAAANMRAIAMDLRGFGESDLGDGPLTMEQCAAYVRS